MMTAAFGPHVPVPRSTEYDVVRLGPTEWGSDTMRRAAEQHFAAYLGCDYVLVHEHAGWYLGYRRDGSIWASANDAAVLPPGPRPSGPSGHQRRRP
jgi:hypothetical protein